MGVKLLALVYTLCWVLGLTITWFLFAPLYSTHSRLWDFTAMVIVSVVQSAVTLAFSLLRARTLQRGWR